MNRIIPLIWLVSILWTGSSAGAQGLPAGSPVEVTLVPDLVDVGMFYRGTKVRVSANIRESDGAVLVLQGPDETAVLNRKGRVAGIWLNVARVKVSNVPNVYMLASSDKLNKICSPAVQQQLGLGTDFLRNRLQFTSDKPLTGREFEQFLKLKTGSGTYNVDIKIALAQTGPGTQEVSATLRIPATIPPGTYDALLYCFRQGELVQSGAATLVIDRVGVARLMVDLAHKHSALYGVLAIVVAMVFGVGMAVIFSSLPGAGH